MKKTQYFEYTRKRPDRAKIKDKWIKYVIDNPEKTQIQSDGRIRRWAKIMRRYIMLFSIGLIRRINNAGKIFFRH
jgi:hypothetical protein